MWLNKMTALRNIVLFSLSVLVQPAFAGADKCTYDMGCLGKIRIGSSSANVERLLGHKISLQFAGDGRAGLGVEKVEELRRLGLSKLRGDVPIKSAALFFTVAKKSVAIDFIGLGIPCADVKRLRQNTEALGTPTVDSKGGGWRVVPHKGANTFVWGAAETPACRFWIRGGGSK
jgi:hypothetical protein